MFGAMHRVRWYHCVVLARIQGGSTRGRCQPVACRSHTFPHMPVHSLLQHCFCLCCCCCSCCCPAALCLLYLAQAHSDPRELGMGEAVGLLTATLSIGGFQSAGFASNHQVNTLATH